jgi:hypothetical protein
MALTTTVLHGKESEGTLKVQMSRGATVNGKPHARGDIVETSRFDALYLVSIGAATLWSEAPSFRTVR